MQDFGQQGRGGGLAAREARPGRPLSGWQWRLGLAAQDGWPLSAGPGNRGGGAGPVLRGAGRGCLPHPCCLTCLSPCRVSFPGLQALPLHLPGPQPPNRERTHLHSHVHRHTQTELPTSQTTPCSQQSPSQTPTPIRGTNMGHRQIPCRFQVTNTGAPSNRHQCWELRTIRAELCTHTHRPPLSCTPSNRTQHTRLGRLGAVNRLPRGPFSGQSSASLHTVRSLCGEASGSLPLQTLCLPAPPSH